MIRFSKIWSIIGAMFIVALISSILLTLVHNLTQQPIKEAKDKLISDGINEVIITKFDNNPFAEKITLRRDNTRYTIYPARDKGYVTSIVMNSFSNNGFGGRIDIIVGFLLDGTVSGYKVISHKETPGLGSKINEEAFKQQVVGKNPSSKTFKVRQDGGEIDAVTGATISSRALIDAIQKAYNGYLKLNTGSKNE